MSWIKIDSENLPKQGSRVLITDGKDIEYAWVTNQFQFVENRDDKHVYDGVTHYMELQDVPKIKDYTKEELEQVFENKSDCYIDCDNVEMGMSKDRFVETLRELKTQHIKPAN